MRKENAGVTTLASAKRLLPKRLKDELILWLLFSGGASREAFRCRMEPGPPVQIRLRAGPTLWMRPQTEDGYVIRETFWSQDALPPDDITPRTIIDVGANIGASMALLSFHFPNAEITGIEPHPENAEMCRRNTAHPVVEAAAWTSDGRLRLSGGGGSAHLDAEGIEVPAVRLADLCPVDYIKLDVEGAERELLKAGVEAKCVNVEVHPPYTIEECTRDLEALGHRVTLRSGPRGDRVIGTKP